MTNTDCDVDAANMHLLLKPDFGKTFEFFSGELAGINQDLCSRCGICAEVCRFHAIPCFNNQYEISNLDCEGCGYCEKVCPTHAITMHERKSGNVSAEGNHRHGNGEDHGKINI